MKWQGYNDKVNKTIAKVMSSRTGYVLVLIAALVVAAAASNKWGG